MTDESQIQSNKLQSPQTELALTCFKQNYEDLGEKAGKLLAFRLKHICTCNNIIMKTIDVGCMSHQT